MSDNTITFTYTGDESGEPRKVSLTLLDPQNFASGRELMRLYSQMTSKLNNSNGYIAGGFELYEYLIDTLYTQDEVYSRYFQDLNIDWFHKSVPFLTIWSRQYELVSDFFLDSTPTLKKTKKKLLKL